MLAVGGRMFQFLFYRRETELNSNRKFHVQWSSAVFHLLHCTRVTPFGNGNSSKRIVERSLCYRFFFIIVIIVVVFFGGNLFRDVVARHGIDGMRLPIDTEWIFRWNQRRHRMEQLKIDTFRIAAAAATAIVDIVINNDVEVVESHFVRIEI